MTDFMPHLSCLTIERSENEMSDKFHAPLMNDVSYIDIYFNRNITPIPGAQIFPYRKS